MPEAPRIPFIRVTRPYGSENEFVEGDFAWVGRTTLVLPGGPARAAGELVRFEVVLANGAAVLRGEGHVVAHHAHGGPRPPGLEVRFTRVDAKSKGVLDRVRERRTAISQNGPASMLPGNLSILPGASMLPVSASMLPVNASMLPAGEPTSPVAASHPLPVLKAPADRPSERSGVRLKTSASRVAPPANREEILERLRARAKELALAGGMPFKKS